MVRAALRIVRPFAALSSLCGLLLFPGCGPDAVRGSDPAATASVEAAVRPPDVSECHRWQGCVPENPCHTGWVTGCRRGEPICTDIGGWLSNGTACGTGSVCYMGECTSCPGGQSCALPGADSCTVGAISCASGQAVCAPAGAAPDGTLCGDPTQPLVCQGGTCTCVPERPCTPYYNACATGRTVCASSTYGWCEQTGNAQDGTPCGDARICVAGWCTTCGPGSWCSSPNPCYGSGALSCSTGACEPAGSPFPNGSVCGPGGETCTDAVCAGTPGARLVLRTASGVPVDVTDTAWSECYANEPSPGMSRLATDTFGLGTFTHTDVVFTSSLDCSGPTDPALGLDLTAQTQSYGDRVAGWTDGAPPMLPPTVTATAVLLSGIDPGTGLPDTLKTLFFVNDYGQPQYLHMGKGAPAADGFPLTLSTSGRPRAKAPGNVVVRTASGGLVDLTGTTWMACFENEPVPGQSRKTTDVYVAGGLTHTEELFPASADCTGTPGQTQTIEAVASMDQDRVVGWSPAPPPPLSWQVLASAVVLFTPDPASPPFKDLRFLDDLSVPRVLYAGDNDPAHADPYGFPANLSAHGQLEPAACVPGAPCLNPVNACELSFLDCSTGSAVCLGTGTLASNGVLCGPADLCQAGQCVAATLQTVTGSRTITFWPEAGAQPPQPYGNDVGSTVTIRIRDVLGTMRPYSATIGWDGQFAIPGVPVGAYYRLLFSSNGVAYAASAVTGAFDLGIDAFGRGAGGASGMTLDLTVNGLEPWEKPDLLEAFSGNVPLSIRPFGAPSTTAPDVDATSWTVAGVALPSAPLVDAGLDTVRVHQATARTLPDGTPYVATARAGTVPGAALVPGGPNVWTAELLDATGSGTFTSAWPANDYELRVPEIHPAAVLLNNKIGVTAVPHADPLAPPLPGGYMGTTGVALLLARAGSGFAGTRFEAVEYGRFLPAAWTEYRDVRLSARVALAASNGSTANIVGSISRTEPLDVAPTEDAAPLVSPPLALTVNDLPATAELAGVGTAPVIRWSAPASGTPTSYLVRVYRMAIPGPGMTLVAQSRSAQRIFSLPEGLLVPGQAYFAVVEARIAPAERLDAPLRFAMRSGFADAITAPFLP